MTISYWACLWGHPGSYLSGHGRTINVSRAIHRHLLSSRVYQHIRAYRYSAIWEDISKDELSGRTILFSLSSTAGSAFTLHESTGPILSQSPLLNSYIARSLSSTRLSGSYSRAVTSAHGARKSTEVSASEVLVQAGIRVHDISHRSINVRNGRHCEKLHLINQTGFESTLTLDLSYPWVRMRRTYSDAIYLRDITLFLLLFDTI